MHKKKDTIIFDKINRQKGLTEKVFYTNTDTHTHTPNGNLQPQTFFMHFQVKTLTKKAT